MHRDFPTTAVAELPRRPLFDLAKVGSSLALVLVGSALVVGLVTVFNLQLTGVAAIPLIPVAAIVATRHPVAAVLAVFLLTGLSSTLTAFTPIQVRPTGEVVLLGLWIGVAWSFLAGRQRPLWLWPALLAPALYLVLTLAHALLTDPPSLGIEAFRLGAWKLSAVLLVALAPWSDETKLRMARAALLAGLVVCGYALFRWLIGPSDTEHALAQAALPSTRFSGPQSTPQQLALWCAPLLPFALALTLAWRGRWRLAGASVVALCAFLIIATEVRTGTVAGVAAVALTLLLFQLAGAFPGGTRAGTALAAALVVATVGVGAFTIAVEEGEQVERFERILTPGEDRTYGHRQDRWAEAWPEITREPFGHGLGTLGELFLEDGLLPAVPHQLDSSYLLIAFEQGLIVLVLFIFAMLALLVSLARRAISTPDPNRAAVAIGACGSLIAILVFLYAGFHIERFQILFAWILVGLGAAQFTSADPRPGHRQAR